MWAIEIQEVKHLKFSRLKTEANNWFSSHCDPVHRFCLKRCSKLTNFPSELRCLFPTERHCALVSTILKDTNKMKIDPVIFILSRQTFHSFS